MSTAFVTGRLVYLRALERSDAPRVADWLNDPEVNRFTTRYRPVTLADEEEFLDGIRRSSSDVMFGVVQTRSDALVGVTGLHKIDLRNRSTEMGLMIGDRSLWGQGLATDTTELVTRYAFETLNMHRVCLVVIEANAAALRVYERSGYVREGLMRQEHFREGRYWDAVLMSMLRPEWEARRAR